MSYEFPPAARMNPDCPAQCAEDVSDFPYSLTYHACTGLDGLTHTHRCACGYLWTDTKPEPLTVL